MDVNNQQDIKEEEFLNNEFVPETNEHTKLLKDPTHQIPLNNENGKNVNFKNPSIIRNNVKEFLNNNSSVSNANKTLNILKDFEHQISLNNLNNEEYVNSNNSIHINNEDENEFLDANESLNVIKDSSQQIIGYSLDNKKHVKHNNCSVNKEEYEDDAIQDVIEISKTEYTYPESYAYIAKGLEIHSNTLEDNSDITDLIKDYICDLCFKSFAQLQHLKSHLSVHKQITQNEKHLVNGNGEDEEIINLTTKSCKTDNTLKVKNTFTNYDSQHTATKFPKCKITKMYNRCSVCDKIFNFQQDLIKHAREIHSNAKALKCRECNECFSDASSLSRHFRTHKDISKPSVCKTKSSKTKNVEFKSQQLNNELFLDTNLTNMSLEENFNTIDTQQMQTNDCDQLKILENKTKKSTKTTIEEHDTSLTSLTNTKRDLKTSNKPRKRTAFKINKKQKCKICLQHFSTRGNLKRHITVHSAERPYSCSLCKSTFGRRDHLKAHTSRHLIWESKIESGIKKPKLLDNNCAYKGLKNTKTHKKETTETVVEENKTSLTPSNVVNNMDNSVPTNDVQCSNSDKSLKKNKKKRICTFCSKSFNSPATLKRHLMIHKEERHYSCTICERSFYSNINLKRHLLLHLNSKSQVKKSKSVDYKILDKKCAVCCKIFNFQQDLIKHARKIHSNAKALKCRECNECFSDASSLSRHFRTHKDTSKPSVCKSKSSKTKNVEFEYQQLNNELFIDTNLTNISLEENSNTIVTQQMQTSDCDHNSKHLNPKSKIETGIKKSKQLDINCAYKGLKNTKTRKKGTTETVVEENKTSLTPSNVVNNMDNSVTTNDVQCSNSDKSLKKNNKKLICTLCSKSLNSPATLKRHLMIHKEERHYSCTICERSFYSNGNLKRHLLLHLNSKSQVKKTKSVDYKILEKKCAVCCKIFNFQQDLIKHARKIHSNAKALKCRECNECFSDVSSLSRHFRTHKDTSKPNVEFESQQLNNELFIDTDISLEENSNTIDTQQMQTTDCDHNSKHLNPKSKIESSIKNSKLLDNNCLKNTKTHKKETTATVVEENKTSLAPSNVVNNMDNSAPTNDVQCSNSDKSLKKNNKKRICTFCSESFNSPSTLKRHLMIHTGERHYSCSICERSFYSKGNVKRHLLLHLNSKSQHSSSSSLLSKGPHKKSQHKKTKSVDYKILDKKCAVCCKIFDYEQDFVLHAKQIHTGERCFKCQHCGVTFLEIRYLKRHYRRSHLNETEKKYSCSYCQKAFINNYKLKEHESFHRRVLNNKFTCDVCSKVFHHRNVFNKHMTIVHSDERPYSCSLCDRSYKRHGSLLEHKRDIHSKKPKLSHLITENKCAICNKIFKFHTDLSKHARQYHPNGNTFKCRDCSQTFTQVVSLMRHYKKSHKDKLQSINTEDTTVTMCHEETIKNNEKYLLPVMELDDSNRMKKSYECEICKRSFDQLKKIKRHLIIHAAQ